MVTTQQPGACHPRFSPNAKPYCSSNPSNYEGLSDSASSGCTPKMIFGSSPALSTPGCNPMAKPFIPSSQQLDLNESVRQSFSLDKLISLKNISTDVHLSSDVPPEILSSQQQDAHNWVAKACQVVSSSQAVEKLPADSTPSAPITLMSFIKSKEVLINSD